MYRLLYTTLDISCCMSDLLPSFISCDRELPAVST